MALKIALIPGAAPGVELSLVPLSVGDEIISIINLTDTEQVDETSFEIPQNGRVVNNGDDFSGKKLLFFWNH